MIVRPLSLSDVPAVNELHRTVWWPQRSLEGWQWLMANPATIRAKIPTGLVLEDGSGQAAAFLGSFVQRFWQGDTPSYAATGFSIIVPPSTRGASRNLIPSFFALAGLDAHYTFNCNALSSPIYTRFGMQAWPPHTHSLKLSWIIRPMACIAARGLRKFVAKQPGSVSWLGERLLPRRSDLDVGQLGQGIELMTDFSDGSDYDTYWKSLRAEGRYMADRSPAMLRWRLSDPDLTQPIIMLVAYRQNRIVAHAMAMMAKYSSIEPATLEILDLDGLAEARDRIPDLVQALMRAALPMGAAKLRLQMLSARLLADLGELGDKARREGGYGHSYVRMAPGFKGHETWQPTPFDGDHSICWRPVPLAQAQAQKQAQKQTKPLAQGVNSPLGDKGLTPDGGARAA